MDNGRTPAACTGFVDVKDFGRPPGTSFLLAAARCLGFGRNKKTLAAGEFLYLAPVACQMAKANLRLTKQASARANNLEKHIE